MRQPSVILLSGGLDSAACLALCRVHDTPVLALTADYGQRAAAREIEAARALSQHFEVRHQVLALPWLGRIGGSALTSVDTTIPELRTDQLDERATTLASARAVWVPNRNGVLLNIAAAYAERARAARIVVGFNREEAATFPDNSKDYLERATRALALSTANQVEVFSYTVDWDKREIVEAVRKRLPTFPFDKVWSCYLGGASPCGKCESCRRFARAIDAGGSSRATDVQAASQAAGVSAATRATLAPADPHAGNARVARREGHAPNQRRATGG